MDDDDLAARFEDARPRLRATAYRMLGSTAETDDAVQETWLRLARTDASVIENLGGWLRTTLTRICLDELRSRGARREEPVTHEPVVDDRGPEEEAVLADTVSRAVLAVLDTLAPAERVAFVLHDMFAVPFDEIGPLVDRSVPTTKKLASRARRKIRGTPSAPADEVARQRRVVTAFLDAARSGDLETILAVLDPDAVRRADAVALPAGAPAALHGADAVARGVVVLGGRAASAALVLVDGTVGAAVATDGRVQLVLRFVVTGDRVAAYEVIADPDRLAELDITALPDGTGASGISAPGGTPA